LARIERGAVIGTQVAISGHLGTIADDGSFVMDIAPVTIGEGAIVGAMAGLGPGSRVGPHELFPAGRLLQPFFSWQEGHKVRTEGEGT
jgi:acetyltransferase-like isoleucine patch superfamily enzyme